MPEDTPLLELRGLGVTYGPVVALDGVTLSVGRGETVALVGVNGAGKSTLLRAISGLVAPAAGEIRFDGAPLTGQAEARVRRGIAHVPERRRIFPGLTVAENLDVATTAWRRGNQSVAREVEHVFALFPRLAERRRQLGWSLSGGEQQMLAIGRALMARPRLILMDEPSLGLAPRIAEEVYDKIRLINAEGVTTLLVEQNTVLALGVAARGYVLDHGRITIEGAAKDLLGDPRVRDAYLGQ
jgi:branched-chain amino acid transport system ATP-binding protein